MIGELYPGEFEAMEHNGRMDALEQEPCDVFDEYGNYKYPSDVELTEPNTATSMPCEEELDFVQEHKKISCNLIVEPCEDAISRQEALDEMEDVWRHICFVAKRRKPTKGEEAVYHDMSGAVRRLPPVNPQEPKTDTWSIKDVADTFKKHGLIREQEPKTGHWEWMPYDDNPKLGDWHCSECRCVVVECVYKNEKRGIPLYKYCPQCGIKMVEPQESEDKCKNCEYYHNPDYTRCHECKAESGDKE